MRAGTAFARAASQPSVSGVGVLCIAADSSRRQPAIKQNLVPWKRQNYQRTLPLDPGAPGAKFPWSGIFSPGTVAAGCELDCSVTSSSRETQPEIRIPLVKNKTP